MRQWIQGKLDQSLSESELQGNEAYTAIKDQIAAMNSVTEETLTAHVAEINESVIRLSGQIAEEEDRQARWKVENQRRRHNYVPLIFDVLTMLSKKNMLEGMFKDAIERKKQKTEAKNKANASKDAEMK